MGVLLAHENMDFGWHPGDGGSEAQNIIRAAEAPPDSPFRPRFRRRSGEIVLASGGGGGGSSGTIGPPSSGGGAITIARNNAASVSRIRLAALLNKQPVAEALARFLTLRDVFKTGSSCRELMNRLLIVGGAASGSAVAAAAAAGACASSAEVVAAPLLQPASSSGLQEASGAGAGGGGEGDGTAARG